MSGFFRKLDDGLARAEEVFLAGALGLMVLVVFADFLLRETLNQGLIWAKELAVYLLVWVGFLGASLAVHRRRHLVIQSAEKLFPASIRKWTSCAGCLLTALLCLMLAWLGLKYVLETRATQEVSLGMGLPIWMVQAVIPLAFLIIGLRFLGLCALIVKTGPISLGGDELPVGPLPGTGAKASPLPGQD